MSLSLRKAVLSSLLAGIVLPFGIELAGACFDAFNVHPGMWWSTMVICVWPTSVVLAETSRNWAGYIAFFIAAIVNGLLYAVIAFVIGYCFRSLINSQRNE